MRLVIILLPACLFAQTPAAAPKPAAAPSAAVKKPGAVAPKPAAAAPKPMTDDEKTIYALGLSMYHSLGQFDLSPAELDIVKKALTDAAAGKPEVPIDVWGPKIEGLETARGARVAEKQKALSAAYLTKAAAEPGVEKTASGLLYKVMRPGTGESPRPTDQVKVNYRGTLVDGTEFDNSYKRGEAAQFPLNGVIKCWTEGVQKMKVGGQARLVCPSDLAYGDGGRPGIPGGATLIFEIELLEIAGAH